MSVLQTNRYCLLEDEASSEEESEDESSLSEESDDETISDIIQCDPEVVENLDRDSICKNCDYGAFLKRSIGLITKSAYHLIYKMMSRCFGTKEDCERMADLIDSLTTSINDSNKSYYKSEIEKLANECMCARNDTMVNDSYLFSKKFDKSFYWFKACQAILRKHKYGKWNELVDEETLNNWEVIACLNIIIHAKAMNQKGEYIFKSFINKYNEEKTEYDFIGLSKQIKCIGSCDHLQGVEFDENVRLILSFLFDLKRWYEACYKSQDCQPWRDANNAWTEIKRHYDDFLHEKSSHLEDVYLQLNELNDDTSYYILITTPLPANLTRSNLEGLGNVPWCCAINYDPFLKPKLFVNKQLLNMDFQVADKLALLHTDFLEFLSNKVNDNIGHLEEVHDFLESYLKSVIDELKRKKRIYVVLLCYGECAVNDSEHSLSFFHENVKKLYSFLVKIGTRAIENYNVLFYTDRVSPLNGISSCFHIPLAEFCNHLHGENCGVLKYNKPMILPSHNGNVRIEGKPAISKEPIDSSMPFIINDFEIVHKYVDKAELKTIQNASFNQADISQQEINQSIIENLTIKFLRGECISWVGLSEPYHLDIKRKFTEEIKRKLKSMKNSTAVLRLYHVAGAGASTLARRVLYDLREKFICLVLRENYKYSDKTVQYLKILYEKLKCSILLLVDEDLPQYNTKQVFADIRSNLISCILLKVTRVPLIPLLEKSSRCSFPYFLTFHLSESEKKLLKEKYNCYLRNALMTERAVYLYNAQTFQLVGKPVIASKAHFSHCQARHSENGVITYQFDEHTLQIQWSDIKEKCSINDVQLTNLNKTSQSFIFCGVLNLLSDFKDEEDDEVCKYVFSKLDEPNKRCPEKVKLLAYISFLFIYHPNRLYLQHYFDEYKDVINQIPKEAYEFVFVDSQQHFKFVHNVVATNILKFYLRNSGVTYSQFVISFLTENIGSVTSKLKQSLLWERQFVVAQKRVIKQPFSQLIENLSTSSKDTEEVLHQISKLFDDFISLSNVARYYSIRNQFDLAKKKMEKALRKAEAENVALTNVELGIGYSQFGDIYRHELHQQQFIENTDDCIPCEAGNELCTKAIQMYKKSTECISSLQNQQHQIYGEIKVRLDYLLFIKKKIDAEVSRSTKKFLEHLHSDKTAKEMVEVCHNLFHLLDNTLLHEDGEVTTTDIIKTQTRFYKLVGEAFCQKFICDIDVLLKKPEAEVAMKRRYVVMYLAMVKNDLSKSKGYKLLDYLKFLFDKEGYKTDYVLQWLRCVYSFHSQYSNIENVLRVLNHWSEHVQYADTLVLLYFYASYFVAALKCKANEKAKFNRYMQGYNNMLTECKEESGSKPKMLWLLRDTDQACKLSYQKPKSSCLKFEGQVTILDEFPGWQVILFSKFYKKFEYILYILPSHMPPEVGVDDTVSFSTEFTFQGIKAIDIQLTKKGRTNTSRSKLQAKFINEHVDSAAGALSQMPLTVPQVFLIPVEPSEKIQCSGKYGGSFLWKGHDFMITLPPDCADEMITIDIKAYLPASTQESSIVSTVFDVTTNIKRFKKLVTIRFPHWINIKSEEDKENLYILIIHADSSEFMKGHFEVGESFGSVEVEHFCIFCACLGNFTTSLTRLTSAFSQFGYHQVAAITQPNVSSITPSNTGLSRQLSMPSNNEKRYLDLLILPYHHKEERVWNGIYCITLDCPTHLQAVMQYFQKKDLVNWVSSSVRVLCRQVTFEAHIDEAELYVVDESASNHININPNKISKQSIDTLTLQYNPQQSNKTRVYESSFPWCTLIIREMLSPSSSLSVKGLSVEGKSSDFSLAFPEKDNFNKVYEFVEPRMIKTGFGLSSSSPISYKVLIKNYDKLINVLNTSIMNLSKYFVTNNLITLEDEDEICNAARDKARIFLLKIEGPVRGDFTAGLHLILDIMLQHGNVTDQQLAEQIKSEIDEEYKIEHSGAP